jgi:hypothetical protein
VKDFLLYLLPVVVAGLLQRWRHGATVLALAKRILASSDNNVTKPAEAVEQAIIEQHFRSMGPVVDKLEKLQAQGKLDVRAADARGQANAELVTTEVVARDGTEEFKPAFPRTRTDDDTPKQ